MENVKSNESNLEKNKVTRIPPQDVDDSAISFKNADIDNDNVDDADINEDEIPPLGVGDEDR